MKTRIAAFVPALVALACFAGCSSVPPVAPAPARASGQSGLMNDTVAGAACDAKNHERPFVIEWDATDMSSFEAAVASDVVFVEYKDCRLKVLDRCRDDSIKGSLGAYRAVDWTGGSLEKLDITNEGELYAKLPLGAASLGGRVRAGEQFHMEYFVSGTRIATRPAIYRGDLSKIPGCSRATHFVYGYNLGAFALGSLKDVRVEAGATAWGIGAGGSSKSVKNAEKKGGTLTSCRGESAREVDSCKVPIRLTLREIDPQDNSPDVAAASAPETPSALNLAGKVEKSMKLDDRAKGHLQAAMERYRAHDGKACLKELDAYDKVERSGTQLSTNPKGYVASIRGECLMLAGQCDAGKALYRKATDAQVGGHAAQLGNRYPAFLDSFVDTAVRQSCQGTMTPRDELIKAVNELDNAGGTAASCASAWATVKRLGPQVAARDDQDFAVNSAKTGKAREAATCFARAGDCAAAFVAFKESQAAFMYDENTVRTVFMGVPQFASCKASVSNMARSPRDELDNAVRVLREGISIKQTSDECARRADAVERLRRNVQLDPRDPLTNDSSPVMVATYVGSCFSLAGDSARARAAFAQQRKLMPAEDEPPPPRSRRR